MSLPYPHNQRILRSIVPVMRYRSDENFTLWQKLCREKLTELLGLPYERCNPNFKITEETDDGDHKKVYFQFQSEPGYYVPCCLCVPKGCKKSLPVMICLQGHSTGMHISLGQKKYEKDEGLLSGDRDFAIQAVKAGYCAITVEQRCFGECGGTETGPDCIRSTYTALLIGRTTIGDRVWDVQRLVDLLETGIFSEVDCGNIGCMGNSGGGTATFYIACVDPRIVCAVPSCSVCTYDDSIAAMRHCPCNYIPKVRLFFDMGDLAGLIAPRPLIIVAGKDDKIFPEHGVRKAYEEIQRLYAVSGAPDHCRLIVGPEGHRFYAGLSWPTIKEFLKEE